MIYYLSYHFIERVWHKVNDKPREQARVQFASMSPTGILSVVRNTHAEIEARFPSITSGIASATMIELEDIPPTPISPSISLSESPLEPRHAGGSSTMPQPQLPVLPVPPPSRPPPLPPPPRRDDDDGLCVVCYDSRANTLLVNCRYVIMMLLPPHLTNNIL